jgi:hypothetical protein
MGTKYRVEGLPEGTICFVLLPEKDDAARFALVEYAKRTDNLAAREDAMDTLKRCGALRKASPIQVAKTLPPLSAVHAPVKKGLKPK